MAPKALDGHTILSRCYWQHDGALTLSGTFPALGLPPSPLGQFIQTDLAAKRALPNNQRPTTAVRIKAGVLDFELGDPEVVMNADWSSHG